MVEVNPESALESEGRLCVPLCQNRARQQKERREGSVTVPHKTIVPAGIGFGSTPSSSKSLNAANGYISWRTALFDGLITPLGKEGN